jgi:hypothetical protein
MKWLIVEDALRDRKGHWLEYVSTFVRELRALGDEVVVLCDQRAQGFVMEQTGRGRCCLSRSGTGWATGQGLRSGICACHGMRWPHFSRCGSFSKNLTTEDTESTELEGEGKSSVKLDEWMRRIATHRKSVLALSNQTP